MKLYIKNFIDNYIRQDFARFHTPGHKGFLSSSPEISKYDITEVSGSDSLYSSSSIIKSAEDFASNLYNTNFTIFSACGATLAIQTALFSTLKFGKKIIAMRNSHSSFINTSAILNISTIWIYPKYIDNSMVSGIVDISILEKTIIENMDVSAIFITSPDYFGVMQDIKKISSLCKKYNKLLIVDNSHGSHLFFLEKNIHPLYFEADIVIDSIHKTLPCLTGSALLHINSKKFNRDEIKSNMSIFGSTSPNYIILSSIENCLNYLTYKGKEDFIKFSFTVDNIYNILKNLDIKYIKHQNKTHLSIDCFHLGKKTYEISKILFEKYIEPELISNRYIVFLISPYNTDDHFDRLISFFYHVNSIRESPIIEKIKLITPPELSISSKMALSKDYEDIHINDSINRIFATTQVICPPGIPIIMPGEKINKSIKEYLEFYRIKYIKVIK